VARFESWLQQQRDVLEDGIAVAQIVLEGPSLERIGTWSIGARDIETSISGMLASAAETLPRGKHQCRLLALDSAGSQLSSYSCVICGTSEAASEAASGRLHQERANALFLSNAQTMISTQQTHIEKLSEMIAALRSSLDKKDQFVDRMIEASNEKLTEFALRERRSERIDKMLEQFAPMLSIGVEFAVTYAGEWLKDRQRKELESATTSEQPALARAASRADETANSQANDSGQPSGSRVSDVDESRLCDGNAASRPNDSEPRRKQRRGSK
jgi:hypothetical protein